MDCLEDIVAKIINKDADYILAVKQNQRRLYENIQDEFRFSKAIQLASSIGLDRGRIEIRTYSIIKEFHHLENVKNWKESKTIIRVEGFQKAVRSHWSIENKLHWTLI